MRAVLGVLVGAVCAAALLVSSQRAHAIPSYYELLRTELEARRDEQYTGTLDSTQKKELKALVKALKFAPDPQALPPLADRVKAMGKVVKALQKAFPAEFPPTKAFTPFGELLADMVAELRFEVQERYDALAGAVPGVHSATLHDRAESARIAAEEDIGLSASAATLADALKALGNALKLVAKGEKFVAKDPHVDVVSATLGADAFDAQNTHAEVTVLPGDNLVDIIGSSQRNGQFVLVHVTSSNLQPVTGPGTYTQGTGIVQVGTDPVTLTHTYYAGTITLVITTLDLDARKVAGTFSFTAKDGADTLVVTDGVFDLAGVIVQ